MVRVIDGDTIVVDIDKGFSDWYVSVRLRVAYIDTPEPHTTTKEAGDAATARARDLLGDAGCYLRIHTLGKSDNFGRWLAEVYNEDGDNLGDTLLKEGHAVPYKKVGCSERCLTLYFRPGGPKL